MSLTHIKQLVIATGNQDKLHEIQALLAPLQIEIVPQSQLGVPQAAEPHYTFIENALAKARNASLYSNLPALADDSGLCVSALQGVPGVHSAYFAGEPRSDAKNNAYLLELLKPHQHRAAYYYCCMVLVRKHDDPQPLIAEGIWVGRILEQARGEGGFGYDPLFIDDTVGLPVSEMAPNVKNKISHRGQAVQNMLTLIQKLSSDLK